jgi:thiol-disulfide isomerase/thioredoxin
MSLEQELAAFKAEFSRTAPAGRAALYEAKIEELRADFALASAVSVDEAAPDFALPNAAGKSLVLKELLRSGPVILTFYRGGWCPYCNIQLRAYQSVLPQISALGARLVAISPHASRQFTRYGQQERAHVGRTKRRPQRSRAQLWPGLFVAGRNSCNAAFEQQGAAIDQWR